jgi:nucleotide-binding universal stress UspA family protein
VGSAGRIVVGVDGSKQSRVALRWACTDARAKGCPVVAVAVWHLYPLAPPERVGASPWWFTTDPEEATRAFLGEVVDEVASDFPDVAVEERVLSGHAAEELIGLSAAAETVVLGATGSGGFVGMALGSTSRAVVEHALCTVVLAR